MALNIKDPATDRLARRVAELTGESITDATRTALEERLQRLLRTRPTDPTLGDIIRRGRARRVVDERCEGDILGYGPDGLPG